MFFGRSDCNFNKHYCTSSKPKNNEVSSLPVTIIGVGYLDYLFLHLLANSNIKGSEKHKLTVSCLNKLNVLKTFMLIRFVYCVDSHREYQSKHKSYPHMHMHLTCVYVCSFCNVTLRCAGFIQKGHTSFKYIFQSVPQHVS